LIATFVAAVLAYSAAPAQSPRVGRIIGNIDGISQDGDHFFISGWACQQGQKKSIAVHVFGEDPKDPAKRTFLLAETADLYSEPAVAKACQDHANGRHRFLIALPYGYGADGKFYVHGIRVVDGVANDAIAGSGAKLAHRPGPAVPYQALPPLAGAYHSLAEHPRVFMTAADLKDLAVRINRPGSYSMARFGQLAGQIKRDLASGIDWDMTYSGCDTGLYNYLVFYEPQDHHEGEIRSALHIAPDAKYPAGAAIVASRLALYAALVKAGAGTPEGSPSPEHAADLAKRILLAWADRGFPRDAQGNFQGLQSVSCEPWGDKATRLGAGGPALHVGRGVPHSVHAQDLLQSFGALNADEESRLNAFHQAMFDLIRQSENAFFAGAHFPYSECTRYTNIATGALTSLWPRHACLTMAVDSMPFWQAVNHRFPSLCHGCGCSIALFTGKQTNRRPSVLTTLILML
jgi:hypothetical protein